ncbi:MAG TPA: methyltransferase domain-containing protein [Candidatus Sulfotelmatobacter sp.]|nr:methyltransferase domain-containing protein [Candidatus Sulfotelmatobacter sp.]
MAVADSKAEWKSDLWGRMNKAADPGGVVQTLDGFEQIQGMAEARAALLSDLGLGPGRRVLEAGCGPGTALDQLLERVGAGGFVAGIDPTVAFVEEARRRARGRGAANVEFREGDIREIPFPDGAFDAAFCDKVLIHVGPTERCLQELARVTKPGGRVGAMEWDLCAMALHSDQPELTARMIQLGCEMQYRGGAGRALQDVFRAAGLRDIRFRAHLLHTTDLDAAPGWRYLLKNRADRAVAKAVMDEAAAQRWLDHFEAVNRRGAFCCSIILYTCAATRP